MLSLAEKLSSLQAHLSSPPAGVELRSAADLLTDLRTFIATNDQGDMRQHDAERQSPEEDFQAISPEFQSPIHNPLSPEHDYQSPVSGYPNPMLSPN